MATSSANRGPKSSIALNQQFTRSHQIGALTLVVATFFLTRILDRYFLPCPLSSSSLSQNTAVGALGVPPWPERGYGSALSLKIYIYEENEIDGLRDLLRGRDGKISAESCVKGQWGTQVKIHMLLMKSKFRTWNKDEADLFFVPSYVKCVRMHGGLNDKEINETFVKVLSQMPYFRLSGGRDHIFVFPSGAGAHLFRSWATFINRSIILTPEGDRTDKRDTSAFNTWKDIIIPGNIHDGMTSYRSTIVQPIPLSERKYLANYLGRDQGKVGRLKLIELAKQFPNKVLGSFCIVFEASFFMFHPNAILLQSKRCTEPCLRTFSALPLFTWHGSLLSFAGKCLINSILYLKIIQVGNSEN